MHKLVLCFCIFSPGRMVSLYCSSEYRKRSTLMRAVSISWMLHRCRFFSRLCFSLLFPSCSLALWIYTAQFTKPDLCQGRCILFFPRIYYFKSVSGVLHLSTQGLCDTSPTRQGSLLIRLFISRHIQKKLCSIPRDRYRE
jgi:hypothetical protein